MVGWVLDHGGEKATTLTQQAGGACRALGRRVQGRDRPGPKSVTAISLASSLFKNVSFAYKISSEIAIDCRRGALTGRFFNGLPATFVPDRSSRHRLLEIPVTIRRPKTLPQGSSP